MKIIGWTWWDDPQYKEMFPVGGDFTTVDVKDVELTIASEMRKMGYRFTGDYHQNGDYGTPIFDDGTIFNCSQRTWGYIMVLAYPEEFEPDDKYAYTVWAWIAPEEQIVPSPTDYKCGRCLLE